MCLMDIPEAAQHWHFLHCRVMVVSSSRLPGGRGTGDRAHLTEKKAKAQGGEGLCRAPGRDNLCGCSSLMTLVGPQPRRAWTLPLGISSAPETGASKLESDLIHNICGADSECQLGPTARPADVSPQPGSLTWQPSSQPQAWPALRHQPGPGHPAPSSSRRPGPSSLSARFVSRGARVGAPSPPIRDPACSHAVEKRCHFFPGPAA